MQLSDTFWYVFGWIGIGFVALIIVLLAKSAYDAIVTVIRGWRWEYKYKHRFDKPSTAACYCKDCRYHTKGNKCENVTWADRYTPDNGFCYEARPMTAKEAEKSGQ